MAKKDPWVGCLTVGLCSRPIRVLPVGTVERDTFSGAELKLFIVVSELDQFNLNCGVAFGRAVEV